MRSWINLFEAQYVGDCVSSFDEDGDCLIDALGWSHTSDFANAEEHAVEMSREDFLAKVSHVSHEGVYLNMGNGVYAVYDPKTDVHYFYA